MNEQPSALTRLCAVGRAFLDVLWPPLCLACDASVGSPSALCPSCWSAIQFLDAPLCACCGAPFEVPTDEGTVCGTCLAYPPKVAKTRSVMLYNDASKRLVLGLKHGDQLHLVPAMATWMHRAGGPLWDTSDVLVPVPLHRWRLLKRRYNQAALLARALGESTGKPVMVDALTRWRKTESQGHKSRTERARNIAGAFRVTPRRALDLRGKRVLLVDDVLTTGATLEACATALHSAGAASVMALTLARAPRPGT